MYWGTKGDQNNPLPWNFLVRSRFSFSNDLILRSRTSTDRWSILSLSNSKHSCKLSASDSLLQTKLYSQHLTVCCKQHCTLSIWQFAANNTVLSASDSLLQTKLYSQHLTVCCKQNCTLSIWQFAANKTVLSAFMSNSDSFSVYHLTPKYNPDMYNYEQQSILIWYLIQIATQILIFPPPPTPPVSTQVVWMRVVQPLFTGGLSHLAFLSGPILCMTCMADRAQKAIYERSCPGSERRGLKERRRKHWTNKGEVWKKEEENTGQTKERFERKKKKTLDKQRRGLKERRRKHWTNKGEVWKKEEENTGQRKKTRQRKKDWTKKKNTGQNII